MINSYTDYEVAFAKARTLLMQMRQLDESFEKESGLGDAMRFIKWSQEIGRCIPDDDRKPYAMALAAALLERKRDEP